MPLATGADQATDPTQLFGQLLECQWRDIGFPITHLSTHVAQDLVIHARPDRDSARVEATGRQPVRVAFTAVFRNGIVPGASESWGSATGALYPDVFNKFMEACADRSTGTFQHPLRGPIQMKCVSADSALDSGRRDGEDVQCEFIETSDSEEESAAIFSFGDTNPIGLAAAAAADLDAAIVTLSNDPGPPVDDGAKPAFDPDPRKADPDNGKVSFTDCINQVKSVVDTATLVAKSYGGILDRVIYRVDALTDSVERVAETQNWPMLHNLERMREAAVNLNNSVLKLAKDIASYTVLEDTTIAMLANTVRNLPSDIISLNPKLSGELVVSKDTVVRYYKTLKQNPITVNGAGA